MTNEVKKGSYDKNVKIKTNDELGELGKNFNQMTMSLKKSRSNIEKKVAERTADLEKLNKSMTGRELKMVELKKKIKDLEEKINENKN